MYIINRVLLAMLLVDREDYNIYKEDNDYGLLVLHSDVYRWTKSVRGNYIKDFNEMVSQFKSDAYTYARIENVKLIKFITMLGFEKSGEKNGIVYFIHRYKGD